MRHTNLAYMDCPAARALDLVGEWWTLLIVRDALLGACRFDDFKRSGISDNILSVRLKRLVEEGIFERHLYQNRPDRYEYLLTEKGRDLGPVVAGLRDWGRKWTTGEDQTKLVHRACGHSVSVHLFCTECARPLTSDEIQHSGR